VLPRGKSAELDPNPKLLKENNVSEKYIKNITIVSWSQQHVSASDVYIFILRSQVV
jgi:hypothetical protein